MLASNAMLGRIFAESLPKMSLEAFLLCKNVVGNDYQAYRTYIGNEDFYCKQFIFTHMLEPQKLLITIKVTSGSNAINF